MAASTHSIINIKSEEVLKLAALGCSLEEIAWYFGANPRHIKDLYWREIELGSVEIKVELRKLQIDKARSGDSKMLIWLGKQLLEQKEPKHDIEVSRSSVEEMSRDELVSRIMALTGTEEEMRKPN